jgi:hypothetical protein
METMITIKQPIGIVLAAKALEVGKAFAASGLHEATGHNDGEQIQKIEAFFGLEGEPYCAMGLAYCFMKAFAFLTAHPTDEHTLKAILTHNLPHYFDPSPSTGQMMRSAQAKGMWRPFHTLEEIHPGEPVLFDFKGTGQPQHVGMFSHAAHGMVVCCEFNTGAGAAGNQADGQGCYVRERSTQFVLGSIAVSNIA